MAGTESSPPAEIRPAEPGRLDSFEHDPLRWGASMANHAELLSAALATVEARTVVEVGAYAGDLTRVLLSWGAPRGARIIAVDPMPQPRLERLAEEHEDLELVRRPSLDALAEIELGEAVIIDGDHNYYTVSEELKLIAGRVTAERMPLLIFHDVAWPHGRRDDYHDAQAIPSEHRLPQAGEGMGIAPGDAGVTHDGLPYPRSAAREGGPGNGVLTAVEDFVGGRARMRLVVVPAFFGMAVVWHEAAPHAAELAALLEPWHNQPLLARLEANRVHHIAQAHAERVARWQLEQRLSRQETVLRRLLDSSAFRLSERLSHARVRAGVVPEQEAISRAEIRRALGE